jgi:TRAP-type mannitol/chloroaromatic compound transport system permease small subunit
MLHRLITISDRTADLIGNLVAPLTFLMGLLTCIVVIARYSFNMGLIPVVEAVIYLHGIVFMLGIPYALKEQAHVRVDIIYSRLKPKSRAFIDLLGTTIFLLPVSLFLIWSSIDYVSLSWRMNETSFEPGGLPWVYLLKTLIPVMACLLLVQGLTEFLRSLQIILHDAAETKAK